MDGQNTLGGNSVQLRQPLIGLPASGATKSCLKVEEMQVGYLYSMASTQADVAGVI